MAANDKPNPNSKPNPFEFNNIYALATNILLTVTFLLFFLILIRISLYFYDRWNLRHARQCLRRPFRIFYVDSFTSSAAPPIGLDPFVIQSLPVFVYSAHFDPVECAICLSDFEENETGRVFPRCNHSFHVEYIDMWFQSHSTCPLCRSLVELVQPRDQPGSEVAIDVRELGSSSEGDQAGEEENPSGRMLCSSSSSIGSRRKPSSVGLASDVPLSRSYRREIEGSTASFRSPRGRMLSFERTLSGERKSRPSSPSAENCDVGCALSMTEIKTS